LGAFVRRFLTILGSFLGPLALGLVFLSRDKIKTVDPMLEGETVIAISMIEQKAGHPLRAVDLTIDHKEGHAEIQNGTTPEVSDRWSYEHWRGLRGLLDWHYVTGPTPVNTAADDTPVSQRVFEVRDIDFAAVPRVAASAIERVKLQEAATVNEMSLTRPRITGLQQRIGTVRWRIEVDSAHESATSFADAAGKVYGVDLTGTLRAQRYDLFSDNQALLEAARALSAAFDGKERLQEVNISRRSVTFKVVRSGDTQQTEEWFADINGARRGTYQSPIPNPFATPTRPFSAGDVDWSAAVRLQQIARQQLGMQDGEIRMADIARDTSAFGPPSLSWAFYLRAGNGDEGRVALAADGTPRDVTWPARRAAEKRANMMAPDQMVGFLAALRATFAPGTAVMELVFLPDEALAILRDPDKPRTLARVEYKGLSLTRSQMPPDQPGTYEGERYDDSWLFALDSIKADVLSALPTLQSAALARLRITNGTVSAIGIGRHRDILSHAIDINVEIDVQGEERKQGRYYVDLRGHELRVDEP
jgi:hypothetical protein